METTRTDKDEQFLQPYDIVRISSPEEDLNASTAYIVRLPNERSSHYVLWIPDIFTILTHRPGDQDSRISSFTLESSSPSSSIIQILAIESGSLLAGTPRANPREIHTLRVVRIDNNDIFVTRTNDITESVHRISLNRGIADDSPYVFLRPGTPIESKEDEPLYVSSIPFTQDTEREREIQRLTESKYVNVLNTELPAYKLRKETLLREGTKDIERIKGQVVSAIAALDVRNDKEYAADGERIRNLLLIDTRESFVGREDIDTEYKPILLRKKSSDIPEWSIIIDNSRQEEYLPVRKVETEKGKQELEFDYPQEISKELHKSIYSRYVAEARRPFELLRGGDTDNPSSYEVDKPTPYILQNGVPILEHSNISTSKYPGSGSPIIMRKAIPEAQFIYGEHFRTGDSIVPNGAVTMPLKGYVPKDAPITQRYVSPNDIKTSDEPSQEPDPWVQTVNSKLFSSPFEILPPRPTVGSLLSKAGIITPELASSRHDILKILSIPLEELLPALPKSIGAGNDEIGTFLSTFGYTPSSENQRERLLLSHLINLISSKTKQKLDDITAATDVVLPNPSYLFKGRKGLQKAYPETFGLIGNTEAFHRITEAANDYGDLLYTINSINEYAKIRDDLEKVVEESRGRRSNIREQMAKVQEELKELEGSLRMMPKVAKHFQSKSEVDMDNKRAAEGKLPTWEHSLDDDKLRFLYSGERLQKITGELFAKLQDEGELRIAPTTTEPTAEDICEPTFADIPADRLLDEVRKNIQRYNDNLPPEQKMDDIRMEVIIQRIIMGGRPVEDGDHALITRHLRTAAYIWSSAENKWKPVKEEELRIQSDDVTLDSVKTTTRTTGPTVYSKTLNLNKEYRRLSKLRDDLELMESRPDITSDPEQMKHALDILFKRGEVIYEKRRQFMILNRILDEYPFVHDRIGTLLRRYTAVDYTTSEDTEEETKEDLPSATRGDLKRAMFLDDELVVDIEQALYEAGMTTYIQAQERKLPIASSQDDPDIPNSATITDPRIAEVEGRNGSITFIKELPKSQQPRRVFLAAIGFAEMLFKSPLTSSELAIIISEIDNILGKHTNHSDAAVKGIATYAVLLMTRLEGEVFIYTTEGISPPPIRQKLPSFFGSPVSGTEDTRFVDFICGAIISSVQKSTIKGDKDDDIERNTLASFIIDTLRTSPLLDTASLRKEKNTEHAEEYFLDVTTRIARSSPGIVARTFKVLESELFVKHSSLSSQERMMRSIEQWESLPVGYRPHSLGLPMKEGIRLLKDEPLLLKDSFGVPYRSNATLMSNIKEPELQSILKSMGRERAETMIKVLYKEPEYKTVELRLPGHPVMHSPAPEFIGVERERIQGQPLSSTEAPVTVTEELMPMSSFRVYPDTSLDAEGLRNKAQSLFTEILKDKVVGELRYTEANIPTDAFLRTGNGENTQLTDDENGSLRCELFAFHDAAVMAAQEHLRDLLGLEKPTSVEKKTIDGGPVYSAHNVIKRMFKGINPQSIEHSVSVIPSGGKHLAVLTGRDTYHTLVTELKSILIENGLTTIEITKEYLRLCRAIRTFLLDLPPRAPREYTLNKILEILDRESDAKATETMFLAANIYLNILGQRYERRRTVMDKGIYDDLRMTSAMYTDVSIKQLNDEANKDRENERQRFIYQLEGLDAEKRKVTRASRMLGIDLAGKVARDPRKFNAEYYNIQTALVAEQQIDDHVDEGVMAEGDLRTAAFGDAIDIENEIAAEDGAYAEVDQIEDLDYDA